MREVPSARACCRRESAPLLPAPSDGAAGVSRAGAVLVIGGMAPKEWFVEASLDGCELATALNEVRNASLELRTLVRSISTASGVPVEPAAQTRLLDATMQQRGVLMALVPGAGGHDAVLALVLPSAPPPAGLLATRQRVSSLWRGWDDKGADAAAAPVCELPVKESKARW